ncbi:unnamed protein product [Blumeria hordei]|uniref:Uncharacterized protein n=1 Tax=Blumeria hordei TaxID=2867405 RepID=A0A383USS8_BLUHO|nr:unnamed protein product [Blumeria hordei]
MMATEATSNISGIKSSIQGNQRMNIIENSSKYHVAPRETDLKRNEAKQFSDLLEPRTLSTNISINGGSDSDTSRAETAKTDGEEKGHIRTASTIRKPASFKPVSVNKTFLAAKGSTTNLSSKIGDKSLVGSSISQTIPLAGGNSARPRLVAKTGPGLNAVPRTVATVNGGKAGGAPDASAVWNKNRPAPAPEPKTFTDEELKQQYGIHLATRLQTDDVGKQANWADIDEDDEEWAPNTMEWSDGTKVTLPQSNSAPKDVPQPPPPPPIPEPKENLKPKEKPVSEPLNVKSQAKPLQVTNVSSLKPNIFSGRSGLVLKATTEKSTLVPKPPGPPPPTKSPWAPLPPVDKVAPIVSESGQAQTQPNRFAQKSAQPFTNNPAPAAKEIAADDFSRSWRDPPSAGRELYNAQSGRYEPANDSRKSSSRSDPKSVQPAVLQRPQQESSVETSTTTQNNRAATQDIQPRRTAPSDSGGASEIIFRRMSRGDVPPIPDLLALRKRSQAPGTEGIASPGGPVSSTPQTSQRNNQNQTWQSRAATLASQSSHSRQGQTAPATPASSGNVVFNPPADFEDPFEVQKKAMQVKRELAIARRRDEEAKEEAERKERIRIKLASMGLPVEKEQKTSSKEEIAIPQVQTPKTSDLDPIQPNKDVQEVAIKSNSNNLDSKNQNSLPSTDEPNPVDKLAPSRSSAHQPQKGTSQAQGSQDARSSQSWQGNSTDRFKPWAPTPAQQPTSRNVWGPPTNDRTLGNGTFNSELGRIPEISSHPVPIGPLTSNRVTSHGQHEYGTRPAPIAPPNRRQSQGLPKDSAILSAVVNSGWTSLPNNITEDDARRAKRQELEIIRARESTENILVIDPKPPVVHDTWRQVSMKEDGCRSKIQSTHTTIHNEQPHSWKPQEEPIQKIIFEEHPDAQRLPLDTFTAQPQFSNAWRSSSVSTAPTRGSRFFPNNKDIRFEEQNLPLERPGSPCLPPPTQKGHPVYDGDATNPHVSLPRPLPIVKLPPSKEPEPIKPPKPISFAAIVATPAVPAINRTSSRPTLRPHFPEPSRREPVAGNWQDKINTLIGRKSSVKTNSLAVDSSSKKALEVPQQRCSATVSLPSLALGDLAVDIGSVESKPAAEVCFEEQEMGSLPPVRIPVKPPTAAWDLALPPKPLPKKFAVSQITTAEQYSFTPAITNNSFSLTIKIPGQEESKDVLIYTSRQKSNARRTGARGGGNSRHSSQQKNRGRDSSDNYQPTNNIEHPVISPGSSATIRGRGRGYRNNWKRNHLTPVHT